MKKTVDTISASRQRKAKRPLLRGCPGPDPLRGPDLSGPWLPGATR